jgi:ferric-dicitrate binding protein FerR (iron transport regulator)
MTDRQRKINALQKEQALWEEFVAARQLQQPTTKGKRKAAPRRKKSAAENEVILIGIAALVLFCIGYYYLHQWGLIQ